jgi:hypothetical protein
MMVLFILYRPDDKTGQAIYLYRGDMLMAVRHGNYKIHLWTWATPDEELRKVSKFALN